MTPKDINAANLKGRHSMKRFSVLCSIIALFVLVTGSQVFSLKRDVRAMPNSAFDGFDPNSYYRFTTKFRGPGLSLDLDENDNRVYMEKSGDLNGQFWKITPVGGGYYRLTTQFRGPGLSLDLDENNNRVYMEKSGDLNGQFWKITPVGGGYYRLTTQFRGPGLSLDLDENNNRVYMEKSGDLDGQFWKITKLN
jgi:hypothetical protein